MPEISRFQGMIIKMLFLDDDKHHKPHVHIYYGEYAASVGVDGELIAGSIPVKQLKILTAWLIIHEDELYKAWNSAVRGLPFDKIEPLK